MDRSPPHDPEAVGLNLAEAYRKALLTRAEWEDRFGDVDANDECLSLLLDYYDARDDLVEHVERHGPVETAGGMYRLNALGTLSFIHNPIGAMTCK